MKFIVKHANYSTISEHDFKLLLSLRYDVFKKRLNWDVETHNKLEQDDYDNANADYLYVVDEYKNIVGHWRLIPTTRRYMLKDTFSVLLGEEEPPSEENIVELSRFAVRKNCSGKATSSVSDITFKMFQSVYIHGVENDIDFYVTVTSTAIERIIKRVGIPCERMGSQMPEMLGETKSIALRIPINEQFKAAVLN